MFAKLKDETNIIAFGYINERKPNTWVCMITVQTNQIRDHNKSKRGGEKEKNNINFHDIYLDMSSLFACLLSPSSSEEELIAVKLSKLFLITVIIVASLQTLDIPAYSSI